MISILILTLNEEKNIKTCLRSVDFSDDIVVFDSFSTDRTTEIADKAGARIFQRQFDDFASQRNAALRQVKFKYPWVLMIDADEIVTRELKKEIGNIVLASNMSESLFYIRRKDMFMGRWLRHSSGYPTWFGRLFRIGHILVVRKVNEIYQTTGSVGYLKEHIEHYPFNKGLHAWIEKHNRYSTMEATILTSPHEKHIEWNDLLSSNPVKKRAVIKSIFYILPFRPFLVFIGLYLLRLGFLDGRAGFLFCALRAYYEFLINCKIIEKKRKKGGFTI
jgi:glycosyltransferase involved in cell wall biosynthesis